MTAESPPGFPEPTSEELDRAHAWARDELVRLVGIPSVSGDEAEIIGYLEARVAELGLPARRDPVAPGQDNLVVGPSPAPGLAVVAHVDTVKPSWEWSGTAEIRGDEVWGLGALDDKGCVTAALLALVLARAAGMPMEEAPVCLGLTIDEEEGGTGSIALARSLRPRHSLVMESSGFDIAVAEAGVVEAVLAVRGRSAHGSLPELGDNAVVKAARLVLELDSLPFLAQPHPLLNSAIVVQQLHGGSDLHVVPDLAEVHIDARLAPGLAADDILAEVAALAARHDAGVRPIELADPWETPASASLVIALRRAVEMTLGRTPELFCFPAWTDAHNMVELGGSAAVVFGPGPRSSTAHRPDEHVDVRDVVSCALVLRRLFLDLWRGDLSTSA